jgi:4-hydroxy-tetrahydrodipicolinate reductase
MRITICGATGRVGKALVDCVRAAPDLALAEAVSAQGRDGTTPLEGATLAETDIVVDFSSPAGTLALLRRLEGGGLPVVVGTTGFDAEGMEALDRAAADRPILVAANFTKGFELFAACAAMLAQGIPDAAVTVGEVYNAKKKPVASGTTQRLCALLGSGGRKIGTDVQRVGETPGINTVTLDYGVATLRLDLTVHSRAAYAEGALDAARWLVGRPPGFYRLQDTLTTEQEVS